MGEQLGALVRYQLASLNLSARGAADKTGGLISHVTLQEAANGTHRKMGPKTLAALAVAVDLPLDRVVDAHDGDLADYNSRPLILPPESGALSTEGRAALIAHMKWLLAQERRASTPERKRGPRPQ